jgi:hypothetical protein
MCSKICASLVLLIVCGCGVHVRHDRHEVAGLSCQIDMDEFLSSLPSEEWFLLEFFFRCLIQEDVIGYTLLGGKPMSFYSYLKPKTVISDLAIHPIDRIDCFFDGIDDRYAFFHKGLEIWDKYKDLFCGKNIFFDVVEQDHELHYVKVIVFNKHLMLDIFENHFHKFIKFNCSAKNKEHLFWGVTNLA